MSDYVFDAPYWLLGLLGVAGITLWVAGNNRQDKQLKIAGYLTVGVGLLLLVLSHFVQTDREKVAERTRRVVEAVDKKDRTAADQLLHPRANLGELRRGQIVDQVATAADRFRLRGIRVTSLDVDSNGVQQELVAIVGATANLDTAAFSGGIPSTWQFTWENTTQGWLLRDIKPLNVPGMDVTSLIGRLQSGAGR